MVLQQLAIPTRAHSEGECEGDLMGQHGRVSNLPATCHDACKGALLEAFTGISVTDLCKVTLASNGLHVSDTDDSRTQRMSAQCMQSIGALRALFVPLLGLV